VYIFTERWLYLVVEHEAVAADEVEAAAAGFGIMSYSN
jgi:hypothetical protein